MKERLSQGRLLPETASLLQEAEALSGRSIVLKADQNIPQGTRASLRLARSDGEAHLLLYNPAYERDLDHLVAHECGHALRFFSAPVEERLVPVRDRECWLKALRQVEPELEMLARRGIPVAGLARLFQAWHDGVVLQLVNAPADLRIERWLYETFPALRRKQRRSMVDQIREHKATLRRDMEMLTPPTTYRASTAMNYAFSRLAAELFGDDSLTRPYLKFYQTATGEGLYQSLVSSPDAGYRGDRDLVDKWSSWLRLEGWFRWARLEEIQASAAFAASASSIWQVNVDAFRERRASQL